MLESDLLCLNLSYRNLNDNSFWISVAGIAHSDGNQFQHILLRLNTVNGA